MRKPKRITSIIMSIILAIAVALAVVAADRETSTGDVVTVAEIK